MRKKYSLIILAVLLAACQKGIEPFDDTGSTGTSTDITGTWNFISLTANTQATQEYVEDTSDYSTVTYSNYISTNNTGTITFNDSDFNSSNIGYDVSSTFTGYNYLNGVLTDTVEMPFTITIDSSNSTGKYKIIGSDSINFSGGGLISIGGSQPVETESSGGRFSISGDILTITQMVNKDTTQDILGIPYHTIEAGTFVIKLQKE